MSKQTGIGIIGLGSIGLRHVNELLALGVTRIVALRTGKGAKEIPSEIMEKISIVSDKNEFLGLDLDGYIVSNPTSLHIEALRWLKELNKPVFVEKPLCSNMQELSVIEGLNEELIQVGFCLRFLPVIQQVKELIDKGTYGPVQHSRLNVGQYLPAWHPYADYREEYYAKKELGGGVLRTLSHELDLALFFFGNPSSHRTFVTKTSSLEIDTDDYALVLIDFDGHLCRIEMDFLSKQKHRGGTVFCEKADIGYDVFTGTIEVTGCEGEQLEIIETGPGNMYLEQMRSFMEFVTSQKRNEKAAGLKESIELMKVIADEKFI